MANLYEEKDSAKVAGASEELNLGQRALKKYTEHFDHFNDQGYKPEEIFSGLYEREMSRQNAVREEPEVWAKKNGMDKFLSEATSFAQKTLQSREDEKTRAQNEATMGDFSRGVAGGLHKTAGLFAGLGMMGAKKLIPGKLGEGLASWFGDAYQEQMRQASLYPTKTIMSEKEGEFFDFSQVQSPGDAIDWVQGVMGDLFPSMAVGIVSGGLGGAAFQAAGQATKGVSANLAQKFIAKQTEKLVTKGLAREAAAMQAKTLQLRLAGGAFGQVMGTALMETGGNFAQAVDHYSQKFQAEGLDPQTARLRAMDEASAGLAMATGLASGMVERLGGASVLLDRILGKGTSEAVNEILKVVRSGRANPTVLGKTLNIAKNLLVEAAKQMPAEFGQEAAQEILSLANLDFSDPDFQLMTAENLRDVLGAGIAGAVGGGGSAIATRAVGAANEALGRIPAPDVKGNIESLQRKIRNQEELLAKDPSLSKRVQPLLEQNRRDLEALSGYAKVEAEGLSYADAAARINEESPSPDGKTFGVRQLKNMLRDGRIDKLEDGTVDPVSLATFLEGRKARAEGVTDPAEIQKRVEAVRAGVQNVKDVVGQAPQTAVKEVQPQASSVTQGQPVKFSDMQPGQTVTLYRGEGSENNSDGEWWTTDRKKAEKHGAVKEVSLLSDVVAKHAVQGHNGPDEFVFPTIGNRPTDLVGGTELDASTSSRVAAEEPDYVSEQVPLEEDGSLVEKTGWRIAGGKYAEVTDPAEYQKLTAPGVDIQLVRDPENKADKNAVKIISAGRHIGYIPAEDAVELAAQMDTDGQVTLPAQINDNGRVVVTKSSSIAEASESKQPRRPLEKSEDIDVPSFQARPDVEPISDPGYDRSLAQQEKDFDPDVDQPEADAARTMERVEFFRRTLTKQLGAENYQKMVDYGLIKLDRLARNNPASYLPRARMATFDPEQMETEQDVLSAFYHEIGVHHGLESLILKHSRPQAWDNFRRSFIKELTGKGPVSNDGLKFREAYERAKDLYVKNPRAAKRFGALDGMSIQEQMQVDYFFHEFLGQLSDMTDWTKKKQPSWAVWLRDRVLEFLRGLGFQIAPTFEQVGSLIQGSVAHILHAENLGVRSDRLIESNQEALSKGLRDNEASPAHTAKKAVELPMNYRHDSESGYELRPELLKAGVTNTFDAIWKNFRTATTRTFKDMLRTFEANLPLKDQVELDAMGLGERLDYLKTMIGDEFYMTDGKGRRINARIIDIVPASLVDPKEWSQLEGWTQAGYIRQIGKDSGDRFQIRFEVLDKTKTELPRVEKGKIPVTEKAPEEKRVATMTGKEALAEIEAEVQAAREKAPEPDRKESIFDKDMADIRADDISRVAGTMGVRTDKDLNTPAPLGRPKDLPPMDRLFGHGFQMMLDEKKTAPQFFAMNALSEEAKAEERKMVDAMLKAGLEKHLRAMGKPLNPKILEQGSEKKGGRQGSEYQQQVVADTLRAMPRAARMQLLAKTLPDKFRQQLASDLQHIKNVTAGYLEMVKRGNPEFLMTGAMKEYLRGVASYVAIVGSSENLATTAKVASLNNKKNNEVKKAREQKLGADKISEIKAKYKDLVYKARKSDTKAYAANIESAVKSVNDLYWAIASKKDPFYNAMKGIFGQSFTQFVSDLTVEVNNIKELERNVRESRKLMDKGQMPFWNDPALNLLGDIGETLRLDADSLAFKKGIKLLSITERIPPQNYPTYAAYVDSVADEVAKDMASQSIFQKMPKEARQLYARMVAGLTAARVYSGRVGEANREKYDESAARQATMDLSAAASGMIRREDALTLQAILAADVKDRPVSTAEKIALEEAYRLAERLRSDSMMTAAIMGPMHTSMEGAGSKAKSVTGYASVEEFQADVISLHEEIVDMLKMSGAIHGKDFFDLAFPEYGDSNAVFDGNMVQSSTQPNNAMFSLVSKTLEALSSKLGQEITIADGTAFPSVVEGEMERLQDIAARMKAAADPDSAVGKLTEEEILLGLIGFGMRNADPLLKAHGPKTSTSGLVYQGFSQDRLTLLQQAGFIELFEKQYLPPSGYFKKAPVSNFVDRSLFHEVEFALNGRQATFFVNPGSAAAPVQDLMPMDGRHLELRRVGPGSMLYDREAGQLLFVGGLSSTWKYSETAKQKVRNAMGYTLLKPVMKDGRVVLEYVSNMKLHTLEDLAKMDLHVVPSVWGLYAGFTNTKAKGEPFEMMDDFEIGNGLQAMANQKAISEIVFRNTTFPSTRPVYAKVITDAAGQERLIVNSGEGQETIVTIGDDAGLAAEQRRLEVILAAIRSDLRGDKTFQRMIDIIANAEEVTEEDIEVAHGYVLEQIEQHMEFMNDDDYSLMMRSAEKLLDDYIDQRRNVEQVVDERFAPTAQEIQAEETSYDAVDAIEEQDSLRGESPTHSKFDRRMLLQDEENAEVDNLLRPSGSAAEIMEAGRRRADLTNEVSAYKLPVSDFTSAYLGIFSSLPRAAKQRVHLMLTAKDPEKKQGILVTEDDGTKKIMSLSEVVAAGLIEPSVNGMIEAGYPEVALHLLSAMSMDQGLIFKTEGALSRMAARVAYATRAEVLIEKVVAPKIVDKVMGKGAYAGLNAEQKKIVWSMLNTSSILGFELAEFQGSVFGKLKFENPWQGGEVGNKFYRAITKAGFGALVGTRFRTVDTILAGRGVDGMAEGLDVAGIAYEIARMDFPHDMIQATIGADIEDRKSLWYPDTFKSDFRESSGFADQETLYPSEFKERLDAHLVDAIIDEFAQSASLTDIAKKLMEEPTLARAQELLAERFEDPEAAFMAVARGRLRIDDASFGARTTEDIVSFTGTDGIGYSLITENQAAANREEYPPLREKMISGADYALMILINDIAPGTYEIGKFTGSRNGRSATVKIADQQVAVEFGERSVLTDFGWSLMSALRRHHDEMLTNPAMSAELRRKIEAAIVKHVDIVKIYGRGVENMLLSRHRIRNGKNPHALNLDKMPAWADILEKAHAILAELTVFGGKIPKIVLHGPTENGWGFANNPETKGLLDASTAELLKRGDYNQVKAQMENTMGLVDRLGNIHIFLGQHATKDGKFDWDEFNRTVYHEGVGHLGLRKLLGVQYEDFLIGVFNSHIKNERNQNITRQQRMDAAEEWLAGKAEQVRMDAAAGRPINRHIGSLLDRVAAMIVQAFRRLMNSLGLKGEQAATSFEVRDVLARAFEGSRVAGRTGLSSLFSPSMIPGENLIRYESFAEYAENTADSMIKRFTDYLHRWEMMSRSVLNYGGEIGANENFMYGLRTQKSRIGSLINYAEKHTKEFERLFKGQKFDVEDVSLAMHALHALERNSAGIPAYLDQLESRMRQRHMDKVAAGAYASEEALNKGIAALNENIRKMRAKRARLIEEGTSPVISGMSTNEAKAILAQAVSFGFLNDNGDGTYSGPMMAALNKLVEANRYAMELSLQGGMISRSQFDAIYGTEDAPGAYKFFVPIPGKPESMLGGSQFFDIQAGNRFKYAQGTQTILGMPYNEQRTIVGAVFAGLRSRIAEASMNTTHKTIYEFAKNHSNPELFQVFLPGDEFSVLMDPSLKDEVAERKLNDRGLFRMPPVTGMSRKAVKEFEADNGYIPVYVAGRMRYMKIMDEGLRRGLEHLNNPAQTGRVMRALAAINRWLIKVNTSLNPEFFIPNMLRDIGSAFNTLSIRENVAGLDGRDFAKKAVKLAIPAMAVIRARNFGGNQASLTPTQQKLWDMMDDFEDFGGKIQWAFLESAEETMGSISKAVRIMQGKGTKTERLGAFKDTVEDLFRRSSDVFENSTRLAVFAAAVEAGATKQEAALMAREITVDFDRKGEVGQALNTLYMFANAGIQGTATIVRTMFRNPGRAAKHVGAIVGFSMSLAILNAFAGGSGDDDEPLFFGISEETRNNHMIFMLPGLEQGVKIPLPWGYAFFWSIGQQMANMVMGRTDAAAVGASLVGAALNNFNPLESAASLENSHGWVRMLAPTIVDPLVDIGFEKTPFGTPLMPERVYEDQPDSARHWRSVSGPSKELAAWLNEFGGGSAGVPGWLSVSPETLDLLFEQATGGLGRVVTRSIGSAMSPVSGKEMTMNDVPLARRFFAGVGAWEDRTRFKSNYDEIHGVNRTLKNLQDNVRLARTPELRDAAKIDLDAFRKENQQILLMRPVVNNVYSRVKAIDEQKKALYKSGLPESEVNPKLRLLDEQQRKIFTAFNRLYYEKMDK